MPKNNPATVLTILTSGRKKGFTSGLLDKAIEDIKSLDIKIDYVWLPKYELKPCIACFNCIRDEKHRCTLNDDMGQEGKGVLLQKVIDANAILIADPVYFWGATAGAHLFFERLYQFLWTGMLSGMPFGSISCASNQGMMREATRNLCKWAFQMKLSYIDSLSVHLTYYEEAKKQAVFLGEQLAGAAKKDAIERKPLTDKEAFKHYSDTPWKPLELYIDNLTLGSGSWHDSMPYQAMTEERFKNSKAREELAKAVKCFRETICNYDLGDGKAATEKIVETAAHWAGATWKEFLEDTVIGTEKPEAYRSNNS